MVLGWCNPYGILSHKSCAHSIIAKQLFILYTLSIADSDPF